MMFSGKGKKTRGFACWRNTLAKRFGFKAGHSCMEWTHQILHWVITLFSLSSCLEKDCKATDVFLLWASLPSPSWAVIGFDFAMLGPAISLPWGCIGSVVLARTDPTMTTGMMESNDQACSYHWMFISWMPASRAVSVPDLKAARSLWKLLAILQFYFWCQNAALPILILLHMM